MKPTTNKVLVKADRVEESTKSGILIKEDWRTAPPTGVVLAVGPDVTTVKKGDKVLFERFGSVILDDDERMCLESQILATYES